MVLRPRGFNFWTFLSVTYRNILGRLYDVLGTSLKDVLKASAGRTPWSYILDHMGCRRNVCRICPQDVGRGHPLALRIGHYGDVLWKLHWDVLRTSYFNFQRMSLEDDLGTPAGDISWHYIEKWWVGTYLKRNKKSKACLCKNEGKSDNIFK